MSLKSLDRVLLNPDMAQEMREDVARMRSDVDRAIRFDPNVKLQSVQETRERVMRVEKQLAEEVADGNLTPGERDALAKQEVELRAQITHGMLDEETMRKCPSDAPNRHIAWERANMGRIQRWKNIRQQLDPLNNEAQNLEPFRPRGAQGRGYRADAAIDGHQSYGSVPQENWDAAGLGNAPNSAAKQAERAQDAREGRKKPSLTVEQRKAIGQRLKAARDKKQAPQQAVGA